MITEIAMLFQYIFRNFILLASSDNDKPMLMRQKENVNKDSHVGLLLIVTDFSKLVRWSSSESK